MNDDKDDTEDSDSNHDDDDNGDHEDNDGNDGNGDNDDNDSGDDYEVPSTTSNHHQPRPTTINHHQPPSTTVNHHQPPSLGQGCYHHRSTAMATDTTELNTVIAFTKKRNPNTYNDIQHNLTNGNQVNEWN